MLGLSKACIIAYDEYINIPYVKDYEKLLNDNKIGYEFILWDRSGNDHISNLSVDRHVFTANTKKTKLSKIIPFLQWRRFVKKIIKSNNYSFVIICTTIPAVLLFDLLTRQFKKRFLLDIRDFTYENIYVYKWLVEKLIKAAGIVVISSKGFLRWLPGAKSNYILTHNITQKEDQF